MYIYLTENNKKPGYIWNLARQGFDMIIKFASDHHLTVIEGDNLELLLLNISNQGIIKYPTRLSSHGDTPMSYIFVNKPIDDKGDGVNNFRELVSLKVVATPKSIVIFAEVSSENLPKARGTTEDNIKVFLKTVGEIAKMPEYRTAELMLTKLYCGQYVIGTNRLFFSEQVSVLMAPTNILGYTYGVPGYVINTEEPLSINFSKVCIQDKLLNDILEESQLVEDIKRYAPQDIEYSLRGTCYNEDIDWPVITKVEFDLKALLLGEINLEEICKLIMLFNEQAIAANSKLTMASFGLRFLNLEQVEKSSEAKELSKYLSFFRSPELVNGYNVYHMTTKNY